MCDSEVDWVDFVMFVVVPMHEQCGSRVCRYILVGNDDHVPSARET